VRKALEKANQRFQIRTTKIELRTEERNSYSLANKI
jgi:hypothetical protein